MSTPPDALRESLLDSRGRPVVPGESADADSARLHAVWDGLGCNEEKRLTLNPDHDR